MAKSHDADAEARARSAERDSEQALQYARDLAAMQASRRALTRRMAAAGQEAPPKLLIADDDAALRLLVSATLASENYQILEAATGPEAWRMVRAERPRLVLLDVDMPGMNGLEVCRLIRADSKLRSMRIVMLTGSAAEPADREAGLAAGADTYLTKPFRPLELIAIIEEAMGHEPVGGSG